MITSSVINNAAEIRARFQCATPFKHVAIDDLLEADQCEALLRDFPSFDPKYATDEHGRTGRKAVVEKVSIEDQPVLQRVLPLHQFCVFPGGNERTHGHLRSHRRRNAIWWRHARQSGRAGARQSRRLQFR